MPLALQVGRPDIGTRFAIRVPEAELEDLAQRLRMTRWPDSLPNDSDDTWADGTQLRWLQAICDYWAHGFDWRAQERALNRFPQFQLDIAGQPLHFIHQRSRQPIARPLLLLHGWPGSFIEFRHVIDALTDPIAHGGRAEDAFHVVVPSLPGYGFSEAPRRHGCNGRVCAERFQTLMAKLGYRDYLAQGGDWGSQIATWLGALDPSCAALHLNLVFARKPRNEDPFAGVSDAERARLEASRGRTRNGLGYQDIQGTKPQTLGYGLNDSPVGLAAWILEKFHAWSDHDGDPLAAISREDMLTNVALYWFTRSITSSMRLYYEQRQHPSDPPVPEYVDKPTAVAAFPGELHLPPPAWIERSYRLARYSLQPKGGHFAALEVPDLLIEDLRNCVASLST